MQRGAGRRPGGLTGRDAVGTARRGGDIKPERRRPWQNPGTSSRPRTRLWNAPADVHVTPGPMMDNVAAQYGAANPLPVYPPSPDNHNPGPSQSSWLAAAHAKSPTEQVFSTHDNDPYSPTPYTPDHPYTTYPQSPSVRNDENMHPAAITIPPQIPPSIGPTRITRRQARAQSTLHLGIRRDRPPSATHHDSEEVRPFVLLLRDMHMTTLPVCLFHVPRQRYITPADTRQRHRLCPLHPTRRSRVLRCTHSPLRHAPPISPIPTHPRVRLALLPLLPLSYPL